MNKKIIYIFLLGLVILGYSCENYDDLIPAEYNKILSLKEFGEKNITLYETGEDGFYPLAVMKGGNDPKSTANVEIRVMNEIELSVHSQLVGKAYKLIPSDYYELVDPKINFTSQDSYAERKINFKTNALSELLDGSTENYVLPVLLYSDNDSINAERDMLILKPEVVTPVVSYVVNSATLSVSGDEATYEFRMQLPFESLWDFECTIEVDETNIPSGFELVPSKDITISGNNKVMFKVGSKQSEPLAITIKNADFFGSNFVVPVKVTDISMQGFLAPQSNFLLYAAYNKINLSADMLSTNAQESSEGPLQNLVDGNPATYFHSSWSVAIPETHYFQINLKNEIKTCQFTYQNRNNANGKPQDVTIFVSKNGSDWVELVNIQSGLPTGAASTYTSGIYTSESSFKYFRFSVNRTNGGSAPTFFSLATFDLFGM